MSMQRWIGLALVSLLLSIGAARADEELDPDVIRKVRKLIQNTLAENGEDREKAWAGLRDMGNLVVPGLIAVIKQKETTPAMVGSIILALGDSRDPRAGPALVELLQNADPTVRRNAARALGDSGNKENITALESRALSDSDVDVRLFSAAAGTRLGSEKCAESLRALARHERPEIRSRAVFALGKFGGKSQLQAITQALADTESSVREDAVEALRRIGKPHAYAGLVKALDDADYKVRNAAMEALGEFSEQKLENDPKAWREWWTKNKEAIEAEAAKEPKEAIKD